MSTDEDYASYVARRWVPLVRTAVFLGRSQPDAEDVVQTTLIRCFRHWDRVRQADRVDAYVHRALVNSLRKANGRRWRGELPAADLSERQIDDETTRVDARADLARVLGRLSAEQRTVLVLRYVADLTEQQVAQTLQIPVGTVKSRVARALASIDRAGLREETR